MIVGTLLTQAVAGFVNTGRWGWPFLAYPMYETAHFEGERLADDLTAYAVLADSTRMPITRADLGMSFWLYFYNVVQPIRHARRDLLGPVMERTCREHGDRLTGLEVKDRGIAIGRDGPVEGLPLQVMGRIAFVCP